MWLQQALTRSTCAGRCAGDYEVAFGEAMLSQGKQEEGGYILCRVPDTVADTTAAAPTDTVVDAACVCCELVARVRRGKQQDKQLQHVLGVVLEAMSGTPQPPEEVERLFKERFKSAGGGQLFKEGIEAGGTNDACEDRDTPATAGNEAITPVLRGKQHSAGESGEERTESGEMRMSERPHSSSLQSKQQSAKVRFYSGRYPSALGDHCGICENVMKAHLWGRRS